MKKILSIFSILIISMFALIFTACGEDTSQFSLHFSSQQIELALGEEQEYDIVVKNYSKTDVNFDFGLDKQIINVKSVNDIGNGRFRIKVQGLTCDTTTLTITLLENKKTLTLPVTVYEKLTNFSIKDDQRNNIFVVRGGQVTFASQMFNFYPETTTQTDLVYSVNGELLENNTLVATIDTPDTVTVTATSTFDQSITYEFNVKVLNAISTQYTHLSYKGEKLPTVSEDEESFIELLSNNLDEFTKKLDLVCENNAEYKYTIYSKNSRKVIPTYTDPSYQNTLFVNVQATDFVGKDDKLVVSVSYKDFESYTVDLEYNVKVVYVPRNVDINGQSEELIVDLFDNGVNSDSKQFIVSVEPAESNYQNVSAEFYFKSTNPFTGEVLFTPITYDQAQTYICVKYKGVEIQGDQVFDDLSAYIEMYGRQVIPENLGQKIVMRFVCTSAYLQEPIYNQILAEVHKSPTQFYIDPTVYENSTIYVKNGEVAIFDDFVVVEEDAFIGNLYTAADNFSKNICIVEQNTFNTTQIKITPKNVGEANYTIILASGISTRIRIVVKEELDADNFWLYPTSASADKIALIEYKKINNKVDSLSFVALRGKGEFEVIPNIAPRGTDATMYTIILESENSNVVSVNQRRVTCLSADNNRYTIHVSLKLNKIENFKLVVDQDIIFETYNFEVVCFNPISSMSLTGLNNIDVKGNYDSTVDVYDGYNLGYVDQPMSKVTFRLLLGDKPANEIISMNNVEWMFSLSKELISPNVYKLTEAGDTIGYFNTELMQFECNFEGRSDILSKFTVTAKISEYGKVISSTCQVNVKRYISVEKVWFYNYVDSIYLDSVNTEFVLYPYIYPQDATNKNFVVYFEPYGDTPASIVRLEYNTSEIKIIYVGSDDETGGKGLLRIIPTSKFDKDDTSSYSDSKTIEINVGDGTIENPLHIDSWEEFKNIDLEKYYTIDTLIDAGGEEIAPLGELKGGLFGYVKKGYQQVEDKKIPIIENVGGIVNFKVTTPYRDVDADYYGLFSKIADSALLMNLKISGSIEFTQNSKQTFAGLLAGQNNGVVKNVSATLLDSNIITDGDYELYAGGLVGKNNYLLLQDIKGRYAGDLIEDKYTEKRLSRELIDNIQYEIDGVVYTGLESSPNGSIRSYYESYPSNTTLFVYMDAQSVYSLTFTKQNSNAMYYFGGIVGYNTGLIKFRNEGLQTRYNYYGTSVVAYMQVKGNSERNEYPSSIKSYIGGAVGYNESGNIVNIVASGRVSARTERHVGGIAGYSENGKIIGNTTRVFVRGESYVSGVVGHLFSGTAGKSTAIDSDPVLFAFYDNKVQATDDRKQIGLDASLIVGSSDAVYKITDNSAIDLSQNFCVSYINRTIPGININITSIDEYFGDIVKDKSDGRISDVFNNHIQDTSLSSLFNSQKYPDNCIVLMYYQAKDFSRQIWLKDLNEIDLPQDLFGGNVVDIKIVSKSSNIVSVSEYGKLILNKTGKCILSISSIFNSDNKLDITIYVVNRVDNVFIYSTPDEQVVFKNDRISNNILTLTNRNTTSLYPKMVADIVLSDNYLIELESNRDMQFDIVGNEYVEVSQSGQTLIITGSGTQSASSEKIKLYPYLVINGQKRYLKYNESLDEFEFIANVTSLTNDLYYQDIDMAYSLGIYKIEIDKTNITLVPSDAITVRVLYRTDNDLDDIKLSMHYLETNEFYDINFNNNNTLIDTEEIISSYFSVINKSEKVRISEDDNRYYIDYTFVLNTKNLFIGSYQIIFSGNSHTVQKVLNLRYLEQPINNVIVKNYSYTDNEGKIELSDLDTDENGRPVAVYSTSYTLTETYVATAGEANILKIVISPEFANYEYIEVTNADSNITGGKIALFGLLRPYTSYDRIEHTTQQILSTDAYFVLNGIRIMKSSVVGGEVNIIYRLSTNILDGDTMILNVNFYGKDGELLFSEQQKILTLTINKSISVSIPNKTASSASNGYYVARGYTYVLDVNLSGYTLDDIVIQTSSPYANIYKDNGTYYLQISSNINYPDSSVGDVEGINFNVNYYGMHIVNGTVVSDQRKFFTCTIVEYAIDDLSNLASMFTSQDLYINMGNSYDVRDLITDQIDIEFSGDASVAVDQLKRTLKENARFYYSENETYQGKQLPAQKDDGKPISLKNFDIKGFEISPKKVGERLFKIGLFAELHYRSGYITVVKKDDEELDDIVDNNILTFAVTVNQRTSDDHPLPINSYEDLLKMSDGSYYILMQDIVIPSGFTPISKEIAKFDGNGYKIIFKGVYQEYSNIEKFGLFESISENTVIANLTISIEGNTTAMFTFRNEAMAQSFNFGFIAAENRGVITNCQVVCKDSASVVIVNNATVQTTDSSYIAALVGVNSGYITNSQVYIMLEARGANVGGIVGVNNGHIASSFVQKTMLKNSSANVNNATAGFAVINSGKILTSFVEGSCAASITIFANNPNNIIQATSICGAFAYSNDGQIADCYANIPVVSSSLCSGFVANNNGSITRCYSTSKLGDRDTSNYPFFIQNNGEVTSCYFLSDSAFNVRVNTSNDNVEGLRKTKLAEFALGYEVDDNNYITENKLFTDFAFNSNGNKNCGIWFINTEITREYFGNNDPQKPRTGNPYEITTREMREFFQYAKYQETDDFKYQGKNKSFVTNRPQLVTANLIAYSLKEIDEEATRFNEETGETEYSYKIVIGSYATEGTILNPYLVYSVKDFEQQFINQSISFVNSSYYRFVRDVDYREEGIVTSGLYKYVVNGYIEGNGMTITGFSINSNETLLSSGYFSQIGIGSNYATIQNLNFAPNYINLPNSINVGVVAGTVNRICAYQINVDGYKLNNSGIVVLGKNIVGGVFGRTLSAFDIFDISSSASTNAYQTCTKYDWTNKDVQAEEILYNENGTNNSLVSYSGAIIGYVGGSGYVQFAKITNIVASIGMVGGFMFGGIGSNATVKNIDYSLIHNDQNFVRASAFGGIFAGEIKGKVENVTIGNIDCDDTEVSEDGVSKSYNYIPFRIVPKVPMAVGGLAGIVRGDKNSLQDCVIYESITFSNSESTIIPGCTGGLIGQVVQKANIKKCGYLGNYIDGGIAVGGLVGQIEITKIVPNNSNVVIDGCYIGEHKDGRAEEIGKYVNISVIKPASDQSVDMVYIGGIIGLVVNSFGSVSTTQNPYQKVDEYDDSICVLNVNAYVNLKSKVDIYGGATSSADNSNSVYVAGAVGGYQSETNDYDNLSRLFQFVNNSIYVSVDLHIRNLRSDNKLTGFMIRVFYVIAVFDIDIESMVCPRSENINVQLIFEETNDSIIKINSNSYQIVGDIGRVDFKH